MDAHGVHVLDEADGDHLVLRVADHLELQLLPSEHRFLDQDLVHDADRQAPRRDGAELLHVVDHAAAGAAHGVGGPDDDRVAQLFRDFLRFLDRVGGIAPGHVNAQAVHGLLEGDAVLAALDGVRLDADDLHAEFVQHAGLVQFRGEVQAGLAAQVGEEGVGPLLFNDLCQWFPAFRGSI